MIKLSPSILAADFANLQRDCQLAVDGGADYIHVDIMDGHFVPNLTVGPPVVRKLKRVLSFPLDVHLMVDEPCQYIPDLTRDGADIITIHVESFLSDEDVHAALDLIKKGGRRAGITLKPATPPERLLPFLEEVSLVLVMLVEPGFGGQTLIPEMLQKVHALRTLLDEHNPGCELEVDGGVKLYNVDQVVAAGANVVVAGSAIFGAEDIPARIRELKTRFQDAD